MVASAANGFMNTNVNSCDGTPHTFHAEYATAAQQNQVPWAALEGGVLMQQEIGHAESCNSVANQFPISEPGFTDNKVFQTCMGGSEGKNAVGEGPCDPSTGVCQNASTEGKTGPVACPSNNAGSGDLCEFADGACFQKGTRTATINGVPRKEHSPLAFCNDTLFQNGDLDFDGTSYQPNTWPDGTGEPPDGVPIHRAVQPGRASVQADPVRVERAGVGDPLRRHHRSGLRREAAGLEVLSVLESQQRSGCIDGSPRGACIWNFGNVLPGVTTRTFGKDAQYGNPDVAQVRRHQHQPGHDQPGDQG